MSRNVLYAVRTSAVVLLAMLTGFATPAAASPLETVREAMSKAVLILNDLGSVEERRVELQRTVGPYFDFSETAKRALGRHKVKASAKELVEYEQLFVQLLEQRFLTRMLFTEGLGVRVAYLGERIDGDSVVVETKFFTAKGGEYIVGWHMHNVGGAWKSYDMTVEGVSLVRNYRSQFDRILAGRTFREFLAKIRAKLAQSEARRQ